MYTFELSAMHDLPLSIYIQMNTTELILDGCMGSCNTLNDLSNQVCVSNKTEDLNLNAFIMITRINKS